MNDYLISVLLGIVEGVTEFLPISSTAHLRIAEALFRLPLDQPYWKMYTVVIQLGAVLCLPFYFRERLLKFLSRRDGPWTAHPLTLVLVAFLVTAIPAFLLSKLIGKQLESLFKMGTALLVGGVVMGIVDAWKAPAEKAGPEAPGSSIRTWSMEGMSLGQAIWIGACQILSAVFPGTSRSMSTIAGGQLAGLSRAAALEFSFFVSIPTMFAATGYELLKTLLGKHGVTEAPVRMDVHGWVVLLIGFVVSFAVAYGSVAVLMAWVRRRGFLPFAIYRLLLGAAVMTWVCLRG
ncbi:MAG TPA: undecaprenyl-diphosphate phosphatase [Planctomycetota bacterium]|nr:undecaprenyl-diphosphate phosphatase [Planctomycetota bacterium]